MIRKGYEKPRCFTISNVNTNIGGWQSKNREYAAVTPPRPRKTLRRSSSFSNDVDIPPLVRQDRALIPAVPRFEQAMKSLDVREGAPACLTCKVYGNPFPGISWLRNRKALLLRGGRIKDNVDEDGRCSLNFLSAKAEDRGSYTCVATNQLGKVNCSALLNVHVGGGFSKPGFSSVKAPVTNAVRRETKIQKGVASHQAPGSGQNSCGESIKSSDSGISRPSSRDTSSTDSYPVFSDNITSSSQAHLRRSKEASMGDRAPQFPRTPRSQVVEESHSVLFQCKVDGSPKPALSWYKGNSKLKDSERIVLSENISGDCSLEILDLTATDAGSYRCVAMNRAGKSSVSVELMLAAKAGSHSSKECPPSFSQPLTDVDVNEGSRARFECKVEARPKPTVEWMKDGELITASSRVRIMEVYGTHSLVLSRTDHGDTGTYTINASNHVGSESCSAQLRVKEPSYSSRGSTPKGLRSGYGSSEVVTPTYSSSGSPATSAMSSPSMSPKLGRAINSRLVSGSVSSPWSTDLKSRSGGVGGGSSQRRRAPGFILRPRPQTIAPGEKLVLKCTLLGHPKPNVTWDRDGYKLDESDDRVRLRDDGSDYFLEVDDCSSSDSGKYTVSAKNSLGKQSATVDITVSGTGASTAGKNRTTSSISVSRTNHHDISDSLNNNSKPSVPRNVKSQRIEVTINSKNVNTSNNENSESERKHVRDYILPPHSHKEDVKPSSTSSYSSYTSSRMSTSSSRSASSSNDESPSHRSKRNKQVAPTFTRRLSSTQVLEGEDLELNCEITGSPTPEMTWTRNGVFVTPRNSSNSIEFKDGVARLRVSRIQSSQAGEYVCQAKNELGITKCSSRVTVKPKPKQLKPKFTRHPRDIRISEGETLTLEAEVSGQPTPEVLWSVDGQEISNGECTYRNNIAKLILHDVTLACSGQYMCTAINDAGEDYAACRVRIKQKKLDIPPEFTAPLSDVKSKEGEDVCLRCMVTGIPEPRVQWLFNDEVLDSGDGIEITYHDGVAALTLDMATTEDTGCFSCVAVNTEGKSTTSCQVVVSETPRQAPVVEVAPEFITRFEDYIRTMEGDCITLACKVKATPDPEITWKINGKLVRDAKISFENGQASMVLDPVTSDHAGNVICMAKNSCGQTKHEGRLYVRAKREAPSFVTQLAEGVEVQEGKEVTFGCQIKGHPQPRVSWTRNGRSLSVLNTETSYEEGKSSVRIRKAGTSDAGRYVCTARNLSGEAESSCMVTVVQKEATQKPAFTKRLADINLDEGQDIRLVCDVTGLPIPAISWILDGQKLEAEDGEATFKNGVATMLMEDAMTEDSGIYECVARNSEGEARTRCNVKVTAKKAAKAVEEGPSFPIQLEDMTINENEDIVLKCLVKGNPKPTITWLLDGAPFTDAECKYSDDGHAELFLPEALPEDDGVYTCIAQNQLNRVMCSCKVTVKAIPKVKRKQISNKEAEPARLESKTTVQTSRSAWSSKKSTVEPGEVKSPRTTPTSSSVNINGKAEQIRKYPRPASSEDEEQKEQKRDGPDRPPKFIEELQDRVVPDGSINYKLVARVSGIPPPSVKWYVNDEEIEDTDDFRYETNGDKRILIFAEIFPEDSGPYTCVAMNSVGEVRSKMKMTVEEIDGDPPNFITKPRPLTVNAGENAVFTCKVDGEPEPTLQWLYCNQPIAETERVTIIPANAQNNYVHSLEVCEATIEDAGRYAACCKNLLGDITCTVSLIVNAPKNQEEKKDFRNVLKHSASTKSKHGDQSQAEQVDFRGVLKRQVETNSTTESNQAKAEDAPDFREALSRPVRTKVLTEEERKLQRAEQKDFRGKLVRKVDTKTVTNEALKVKSPSQKDFRDEALKTKVKTKAYAEEVIKQKHAEQVDFRAEALKTKVTPKAYREENIKAMRAEQVDFREVLSPTAKRLPSKEEMSPTSETPKFELSGTPAKMKLNKDKMEHNTVATRRARARGGVAEPVRRTKASEEEVPKGKAPEFNKEIEDKKVNDASPFELVCHVTGHPPPKVSWFLGDEEIHSEADISITQEGGVCKLAVTESFPDDEGTYLCRAENEHGVAQCSAHVTVVTDGELECEQDS